MERPALKRASSIVQRFLNNNKFSLAFSLFLRKRHFGGSFLLICKRYLRAFLYTFNLQTLTVLTLSLVSVFICLEYDIRWNMDFSMVATGTVFPLTFAIGQAFGKLLKSWSCPTSDAHDRLFPWQHGHGCMAG